MKIIKVMGLVAVAALTLGAQVASASTPGFVADQYPAAIKVTPTSGKQSFKFNFTNTECDASTLSGEVTEPSETLSAGSTESQKCNTYFSYTPTFSLNSCKLIFHPAVSGAGTFEIGPANCGGVTVKNIKGCDVTMVPQSGLKASYENVGSGSTASVKISLTATGMKYTESGSGCAKASPENGTWTGSWEVTGKYLGAATGVRFVDLRTSFTVSGTLSEEGAKQPAFEAGEYPAAIVGEQSAADRLLFTTNLGTQECEKSKFGRGMLVKSASLPLTSTEQANCVAFGFANVTVKTNGCEYVLRVPNAAPVAGVYNGELDVTCPGTSKIEIPTPGCTVKIGSQSGLGGVTLAPTGSEGSEHYVVADFDVKGMVYTETPVGIIPTCSGVKGQTYTYTDGTLGGSMTLKGYNGSYIQ